jgi:tetratricopeptide (TPR) repeat protein
MKWIVPLCLVAAPAFAETCPPVADHSVRLLQIIASLGAAKGQEEASIFSQELWALWTDAPDERAQALLNDGMARRSNYDFLGSRTALNRLIEYCPAYAEGYNQRAFTNYLQQDFEAALVDLDRALNILPTHVAALSGKALTLMGLGRSAEAQEVLRAALALNPWLQERALLAKPIGTDL